MNRCSTCGRRLLRGLCPNGQCTGHNLDAAQPPPGGGVSANPAGDVTPSPAGTAPTAGTFKNPPADPHDSHSRRFSPRLGDAVKYQPGRTRA